MSGTKTMCKWINNNTFLAISDFVDKRFLDNFAFGRLRTSSDFFGNLRKWSCGLQKSQNSQDKNLTLISQKKLAGIKSVNELPYHTQHDALLIAFQPPLKAIDCFWQTHCDETLISRIELGLPKKPHQLLFHLIFFPCISVVRCCCESSFRKITCHVTPTFLW